LRGIGVSDAADDEVVLTEEVGLNESFSDAWRGWKLTKSV
jgi:hypothetical protein